MTLLHELTQQDAWAAGFKNREHFFEWWRMRYLTGPLMEVECWAATYQREELDIPQFQTHPIAGKRGDYTANREQTFDDLESVDATEWAAHEEQRRNTTTAQAKLMWRMQRRQRKAA